jgi:hypothetical protein
MTDELKAALEKAADDVAADARIVADARIATLIMAKTTGMPAGQTLDRVEAEPKVANSFVERSKSQERRLALPPSRRTLPREGAILVWPNLCWEQNRKAGSNFGFVKLSTNYLRDRGPGPSNRVTPLGYEQDNESA